MFVLFMDNAHREILPGLSQKADLIINRTSMSVVKTPWLEEQTRENIVQLTAEMNRVEMKIVPFNEQKFAESEAHTPADCPHPACSSLVDGGPFEQAIALLQSELEAANDTTDLDAAEGKAERLTGELSEATALIGEKINRIDELEKEAGELQRDLREAKEQITDLQQQLDDCREKHD